MSDEQADRPVYPEGGCGDAAVYLLGLLDDEHAAEFLDHVRACAVCGDELGALAPAVDILPASVPQHPAPAHVKQRVMSVVREEAELQTRASSSSDSRRGWRPSRRFWMRSSSSTWFSPRGLPRPALALVASAALLAGGVGIGSALSSSAGSGGMRVVSADVTLAGAHAALHQSGGTKQASWLTVAGMPQPRAGRVYEVWVKRPGRLPQATSSLFMPTSSGMATVAITGSLHGVSEVMVTQEPAGGSQMPTSPAVIVAHLV